MAEEWPEEHAEMLETIRSAVENRRVIFFVYDGKGRRVEPYSCGISTAGNVVMRGFQDGYYSSSDNFSWKLYTISKMSDVKILDAEFAHPRPDYNPDDRQMTTVFFHI